MRRRLPCVLSPQSARYRGYSLLPPLSGSDTQGLTKGYKTKVEAEHAKLQKQESIWATPPLRGPDGDIETPDDNIDVWTMDFEEADG